MKSVEAEYRLSGTFGQAISNPNLPIRRSLASGHTLKVIG